MAIMLKGEAEFQHDGKLVKLVVDVAVLLKAEQETGFGVFDLVARANSNLSVMASLLRHALVAGGGDAIDLEAAAKLVLLNDDVAPAVLSALSGALPPPAKQAQGDSDKNPPVAARKGKSGTGTKS